MDSKAEAFAEMFRDARKYSYRWLHMPSPAEDAKHLQTVFDLLAEWLPKYMDSLRNEQNEQSSEKLNQLYRGLADLITTMDDCLIHIQVRHVPIRRLYPTPLN